MVRCNTVLFILGCVAVAQAGWQLTFSDEFNGQTVINSSAWITAYSFAPVTINDEQQFYSPGGFTFGSDYLRIVGEKKSINGFDYQSGVITTNGRFAQTFGYFEMRARWMSGRGLWPAFWLLGQYENAGVTEIDILESLLQNPETVYVTYHCNNKSESAGSDYTGDELADQNWHTYSVQWNPDIIIWYIDGIPRFNTTMCVPTYPMYMLANMAVGGSWPGPPNATTPFPAYMDIDYIHAYQYVDSGGVSLEGPGEGLAFTMPTLPALPVVSFGGPPTVTPNNADRGDNVTFTFTFTVNEGGLTTPVIGLYVQDWMTTNGSSVISDTINLDSLTPGTTRTVSFTETIPDALEDGYYRVIFGVFNNGGADGAFWQDCVAVLGINSIVGGREMSNEPMAIPTTASKTPLSSSGSSIAEFGCFVGFAAGILLCWRRIY